jgi:hypothetical protein
MMSFKYLSAIGLLILTNGLSASQNDEEEYIHKLTQYYESSKNVDTLVLQELKENNLMALSRIDLENCNITPRDVKYLSSGFLSALTYLNLNYNPIGNKGVKHLAFGNLLSIDSLFLKDTKIGDFGAICIGEGKLTKIKILDLSQNSFGENGLKGLFSRNLKHLTSIKFNRKRLTPEAREILLKRLSSKKESK